MAESQTPGSRGSDEGHGVSRPKSSDIQRPAAGREQATTTVVALLLTVAAVLAALVTARAALLEDEGSDKWHEAVQDELIPAALTFESVRYVYHEEASAALAVLEAQIRAAEFDRAARSVPPGSRPDLLREARAQRTTATQLEAAASSAGPLFSDPQYRRGPAYDVVQRLRDEQSSIRPETDPDLTAEEGASLSEKGTAFVASTLPFALAFMAGALAQGFPEWRLRMVRMGFGLLAIGLLTVVVLEVAL